MARWQFATRFGDTYTFEVNPNAGGSPRYKKQVNVTQPVANSTEPGGGFQVILFEGRPEAPSGQVGGVTLSENQLQNLTEFFQQRAEIIVTDDLERVFTIVPTAFSIKRGPKRFSPFRCVWTMDFILIDPAVI